MHKIVNFRVLKWLLFYDQIWGYFFQYVDSDPYMYYKHSWSTLFPLLSNVNVAEANEVTEMDKIKLLAVCCSAICRTANRLYLLLSRVHLHIYFSSLRDASCKEHKLHLQLVIVHKLHKSNLETATVMATSVLYQAVTTGPRNHLVKAYSKAITE